MQAQLLILDFGSQYTQLIARTVRELGVYCEIVPGTTPADKILTREPKALILSGGPASVIGDSPLRADRKVIHSGIPMFSICYGMQLIADEFGGRVEGWSRDAVVGNAEKRACDADIREFGRSTAKVVKPVGPFSCLAGRVDLQVWMSHGDRVTSLPQGFETLMSSEGSPIAAFGNEKEKIFGVQFHPEVQHTQGGKDIFKGFIFNVANITPDWDAGHFIEQTVTKIAEKVPSENVVCGLSGGVDSTVAAALVHKSLGDRLYCIFVDNGLLRHNEANEVMDSFKSIGFNIRRVDAGERFLHELNGVTDPETKRKIIGRVFIEVFQEEARKISNAKWLVQGTLYPDVIESVSVVGKSATIKSHHNVGGLIENMELGLIEPLRELFKDEVRIIGTKLGLPEELVYRQPFPGPGLAVRCLGDITEEKLAILRRADRIVQEEVRAAGLDRVIWQSFAVLLPVQSVGVMGDGRTYERTVVIRAITSQDGMTADWFMFPEEVLRRMSSRIVNETDGVNRVVLDVSTKPPATIEWE